MKKRQNRTACAVLLAAAVAAQPVYLAPALAADASASASHLLIDLQLELPTPGKIFTVSLAGGEGRPMTLNQDGTHATYQSGALAPGAYKLEIRAEGYLPYVQDVTIQAGLTTKLELHNSQQVNAGQGGRQFGVMAVGDVDGSGRIDQADAACMMDAIDAGSRDAAFDLNGDGAVNVADLTYITLNYGANVAATPLTILSTDRVQPQANAGVIQSGKLDDLTDGADTYVQFKAADGQVISADHPVELSLTVTGSDTPTVDGLVIAPPAGSDNHITDAVFTVEDTTGNTYEAVLGDAPDAPVLASVGAQPRAAVTAKQESDGTIVINLGQQIAVKTVTIKITGASTNLVDIAQVEFVNGMENRIPEPDLNIPEIRELKQLSAGNNPSFSVSWNKEVNVTGYEVAVSAGGKETITPTTANTLTVTGLGGKLQTYTPYTVRVRATNGSWKSPYSEAQVITLKPEGAPPAPESVSAAGEIEAIRVSWKKMRDTQTYSVHYRAQGETDYQAVTGISANSYTLTGLQPNVPYEVYVVGHNELGDSPRSEVKQATPYAAKPLEMPQYKRINTSNGTGKPTAHIERVELNAFQSADPFAIADDDLATYATADTWDTGGFNTGRKGPIITLDQEYEMDTVRFSARVGQGKYQYVRAYSWDAAGNESKVVDGNFQYKTDENGNPYYELQFAEPKKVKQLQLCLANYAANGNNTISEIAFYHYDSIADDIEALFADDTHSTLQGGVTLEQVEALQARLDTPDPSSGELHPDKDALQMMLDDAKTLLGQQGLGAAVQVNNRVTAQADQHLDFAMSISALQPLGKTVQAGEQINVYVGAQGQQAGTDVSLELVFTQNHGESSKWQSAQKLKAGVNTITVPDLSNRTRESGGALYVRYTGSAGAGNYSVRVSGGQDIPVLDVSGKTGQERTQAIQTYVSALEQHVGGLAAAHDAAAGVDGSVHKDAYDAKDCVRNVTDIVMDNMMYSVPASQVWGAIGGDAAKLETAIAAMEQQMDLFYQHKGLSKGLKANDPNRYPAQRQNIRYQKMFDGAFMYAGGTHIGIEFDSVGGLFGIAPVETDDQGNKIENSGQLTGWGVAHEIGHVINSKAYAVAETTNNYYSILATGDRRSDYDAVYKAVTSDGAADERTALAMYWQLHMYYDPYGDYKMFDTQAEQLENLFFARVDSYVRNPGSAPKPKDIALTLSGSKQDQLVRLASAAAQKDLRGFFEAWGFTWNEETDRYAGQFPAETAPVQYMRPDAQAYRLKGGAGMADGTSASATLHYSASGLNSNQVTLELEHNGDPADLLGYEILRNGEAVAFVPAGETQAVRYTDTVTTGNNRVYQYEVIAYDKLLRPTDPVKLNPIKVEHDGTLGRDKWTAATNMESDADEKTNANENSDSCGVTVKSAISRVIDGKGQGYTGRVTGSEEHPEVVVKLGETNQVTALRYKGDAADLKISVSEDGETWQTVRAVTKSALEAGDSSTILQNSDGSWTIYFENKEATGNLLVCDAEAVKLELPGVGQDTDVTIHNLDLLGPVGDNVDLLENGIGTLHADYVYGDEGEHIPAGSAVFTGTYKGNPAYNVVLLKDETGKIIEGSQVILAPAPTGGKLGDVAEGTWIYWVEPGQTLPERVKAELYRVDEANQLTGERLVSDTLYQTVPDTLPEIELQGGQPPVQTPDVPQADDVPDASDAQLEDTVPETDAQPEDTEPVAAAPQDGEAVFEPRMVLGARTAGVQAVRTAAVTADAGGKPVFTMTPNADNAKRAQLALTLGDQTAEAVIAMQAAFTVTDGVTGVQMDWSDVVAHHALLKECRYDAKNKIVTVYITAKDDLLDAGVLTLGELSMQSARGTRRATLTLKPDSVVTVGTDYAAAPVTDLTAAPVELETDEARRPGGGSGSGGSTSRPDSDKEDAPQPDKDDKPAGEDKPDVSQVFGDVAPTAWYYDAVQRAYDKAWFQGITPTSFAPNGTMTRGMFVTVLGRFAGVSATGAAGFADVPADSYYAGFVAWAAQNGIVNGMSATQFAPNNAVTREQMAVMVHGYLKSAGISLPPVNAQKAFADDAAISPWAREAVSAMQQAGVLSGMTDGTFQPKGTATRAEVATLLMNLENRIGK